MDRPAQEGAVAPIMKRRDDSPILKYCDDEREAKAFSELLESAEKERRHWAANDKIWPLISAVTDSIRSIIGDGEIDWAAKQSMLRNSVEEFLAAIREKAPEVEAELNKYLCEGVQEMTDIAKKLEQAEAALEKAKADLATVTAERDAALAKAKTAEDDKSKMEEEMADMKKRGDDEILKVGDTEIRKSEVGEAQFKIFKAQDDQIRKQREEIAMADFRKRADDSFGHLPGTTEERASVLKAMGSMDEATRKSLDTILTAAEKMAATGFTEVGHQSVEVKANLQKAKGDFEAEVQKIAQRDNIAIHLATQKARAEHPGLWKSYYDAQQEANIPA